MKCYKKCYENKIDALIFASSFMKNPNSETSKFRAYKCRICKKWHLTKKIYYK